MSQDDQNEKKPDPIEDVRKGLGLLFRAAKTAVNELPTDKLEKAVVSGVKEVGKAIENVAQAVDKEVFQKVSGSSPPKAEPETKVRVDASAEGSPASTPSSPEETKPSTPPTDDAPKS